MSTLYLVNPGAQKDLVEARCFGTCGKILIGGIELLGAGWCPCKQDVCPCEEKQMDVTDMADPPTGFDKVVVRKLE